MPLYRYTRWDGSQQVFPIGEEDLMEQLAEQMAAHGDVSVALRSLAQKGLHSKHGQNIPGIEQMLQRLRNMRKDALDKYELDPCPRQHSGADPGYRPDGEGWHRPVP